MCLAKRYGVQNFLGNKTDEMWDQKLSFSLHSPDHVAKEIRSSNAKLTMLLCYGVLALPSAEQEHGSSIVETKNVNAKNIMILISDLETPKVRL